MGEQSMKDDNRFSRTIQLIGEEKFHTLQQSSITIVGLGAVGGYVLEGLVRAGIRNFRLVDFDSIEPSNINRQILATSTTLGELKVEEAKKRALDINPACCIEAMNVFVTGDNTHEILTPAPDMLIDAIDGLNAKVQLLLSAYAKNIPTISSMGAALRTDPAKIQYGDIMDTSGCPLARHVRKRLRRRGVERGLTCVYSTETVSFDYPENMEKAVPNQLNRGRIRTVLGSLPTITGIFGLYIANRVCSFLTQTQ